MNLCVLNMVMQISIWTSFNSNSTIWDCPFNDLTRILVLGLGVKGLMYECYIKASATLLCISVFDKYPMSLIFVAFQEPGNSSHLGRHRADPVLADSVHVPSGAKSRHNGDASPT
jgi:hypothetical protein